jgi:hypothetical protein
MVKKITPLIIVTSILGILFLLTAGGFAIAAPNAFTINWWTVDGGGGTSQGGDFTVSGNIGQHDTSPLMEGGDYSVVGGFWGGAIVNPDSYLYLPLVLR